MRFYATLLMILIFSGCGSTILNLKGGVNENLPALTNISVLNDVSSIAFEWTPINNPNVMGYVIYRSENNRTFKEIKYISNPNVTHFVDTNLAPEKEYQYYFITIGENYYSKRSNIIKTKTSFIDAVENLYASNDYPRSVKLIWTPHFNPSVSEYLIQKEINNQFKTISNISNRLTVEYFDNDLKDGETYKYRIIAKDFLGNPSRPSKIVIAKTKDKPDALSQISASNDLPKSIIVSWENNQNSKQYKIYRSKTQDGEYKLIGKVDKNKFIDNIGNTDAVFFYKVSVLDSNNIESILSSYAMGATKKKPKQPIIIKGHVSKNNAEIEWEKNNNVEYFIINRKQGLFGKMQKFKTTDNKFSDKDVKIGESYIYSIIAIDESGLESNPSEEVSLSIK